MSRFVFFSRLKIAHKLPAVIIGAALVAALAVGVMNYVFSGNGKKERLSRRVSSGGISPCCRYSLESSCM